MFDAPDLSDVPGNPLLLGVAGSHAYNMAHADSDVDFRGVYAVPTRALFGLDTPAQSFVQNDPDLSMHEVGKFLQLAMSANPTVLETLYYSEYVVKSPVGTLLVENRDLFITQRIRDSHIGYAKSQFSRLMNRGDSFSAQTKKRTEKHARHLIRLVWQAQRALSTGEFRILLTQDERDAVFEFGRLPFDEMSSIVEREFDKTKSMPTDLPKEPDFDKVNDLLKAIRWWDLLNDRGRRTRL